MSSGAHVVLVLPWLDAAHSFVLQLISLAGLHLNAVTAAELAARFKTDGMLAYVDLIQKKEKEIGCDVLTHQKWYVIYPFTNTGCY